MYGVDEVNSTQKEKKIKSKEKANSEKKVKKEKSTTKKSEVKKLEEPQNKEVKEKSIIAKDEYVQIDIALLDSLVNLVGELVLSRNQILTYSNDADDHDFAHVCQGLNYVTSQIQEKIMKIRLQPIRLIWNKFTRIVRDVSVSCGKKVDLKMEGSDTTIDKSIIEAIKDPLTHLIRNSIDHGIETPKQRKNKGKIETGIIHLRAFQENGKIIIEIQDDGKGLNKKLIQEKAIEKGILTRTEASGLSEQQLYNIIFAPGFSTKSEVTNLSGRGVGMDVVKTNIENIGGSVDVFSKEDHGSTFRITIPLTLAIIPTLIIECEKMNFAIPQSAIIELIRIKSSEVEKIDNVMVYRLRGMLLPILDLSDLLDLKNENKNDEKEIHQGVIVQANEFKFGIIVNEIQATQDIVVKPISSKLKELLIYSGVTILGDGEIALILDVNELSMKALLNKVDEACKEIVGQNDNEDKEQEENTKMVLIVNGGNENQIAVPLEMVKRLEKFKTEQISKASGMNVIEYHSEIIKLIKLSELINNDSNDVSTLNEKFDVFVYSVGHDGPDVGIIVNKIIDSVEHDITISKNCQNNADDIIAGAKIIDGVITEIISVKGFEEKVIKYLN